VRHLHSTQVILPLHTLQLIDHVHAYKPLLTRIKKEYEDVINKIERGKSEAGYLNDQIQTMAQEPSTLRNYRRRHDELARRFVLSSNVLCSTQYLTLLLYFGQLFYY